MIVIDASVANKLLFTAEEGHAQAKSLFERHIGNIEHILVPDLLFYECANTLVTKGHVSQRQITLSLSKLYKANLQICIPNEQDMKQVAKLARLHRVTVYDMLYAAIAKKRKIVLITADERFVEKTRFRFVKLLQDLL